MKNIVLISFKLKTGQSNGQNWQILQDWAILILLVSRLGHSHLTHLVQDKCACLFKTRQVRLHGQTVKQYSTAGGLHLKMME